MRLYLWLALGCLALTVLLAQRSTAGEAADDQQVADKADENEANENEAANKAADDKAAAPAEQPQPAAQNPNDKPRPSRVPKHAATPNPRVQRTPRALPTEQQMLVPEAMHKPLVKSPQPKQQAVPQPIPARQPPNPQFGAPHREGLSPAAAYRFHSMGNHLFLSPAMRWHLNRYAPSASPQRTNQRSDASTVPGQGAENYYPGVSRLPTQKPFADLERPPSGLQSYWPLLLEGREDRVTGDIIWTLP